ncbi:MAG: outer membrane protein assembly factor BamD [Candidatus Nephrothrix sp. EaCA]|nr:MAG: outer membrane protein assembly factor BamD [Candidatus Nephrothrix sp. EaCA]
MSFVKQFRNVSLSIAVLSALLLASCGQFRRIQKSADWRIKYEAGLRYYEKKDYYRTAILFEEILPIVRGLPEGEKVQFYLAYCQFYERTYLLAANQFKVFSETYGRSAMAEEAIYMHAYSLYQSAPPYNNDQDGTVKAMDAMQSFLNRYQASTFAEKAVAVIADCQNKLERKGFENARLYLKLEYYEAAVVSLDNFNKSFPDSKYVEESSALRVRSQYLLAKSSIRAKQLARYQTTIDIYKEFLERFPSSAFLPQIESFYAISLAEINKIKLKSNNS